MKQLVFVHGRSQEDHDAAALKKRWMDAWAVGLQKSGLQIPVPPEAIRFPYYGNTLRDLVEGKSIEQAARVIVKGAEADSEAAAFLREMLEEYVARNRISETDIRLQMGPEGTVTTMGPQNWGWVQAVLRTLDTRTGSGGALIAAATNDVYQYLTNSACRKHIEDGVERALDLGVEAADGSAQPLPAGTESVVVSHSLGTIVAYTLLQRRSKANVGKVPLLVTLGSPLGIRAVRSKLKPISHPSCVGKWFNAMDPNDVVALYPLDARNFGIDPEIENKTDVVNHTSNQHSIHGYLDDPVVAKRIHDAVIA